MATTTRIIRAVRGTKVEGKYSNRAGMEGCVSDKYWLTHFRVTLEGITSPWKKITSIRQMHKLNLPYEMKEEK